MRSTICSRDEAELVPVYPWISVIMIERFWDSSVIS